MEQYQMTIVKDQNTNEIIHIRKAVPEDAPQIIRLIRKCYGDACSDVAMYDEQKLRQRIANAGFEIYVAESQTGIVVAMENCYPREDFTGTLYLKNKMTLEGYQHYGIGKEVTRCLMEQYDFAPWKSAYAYALTYNGISQGLLMEYGFTMTGLAYNSFLKSAEVEHAEVELPKRSHVIMVRNISVVDVGTLYVPPELAELAEEVYTGLKVAYKMETQAYPPVRKGSYACEFDPVHQNAEIIIDCPGTDFYEYLEQIFTKYKQHPLLTEQIYLNMRRREAVWAYDLLKKNGWIVSGFKPLGDDREYIVMYYSPCILAYPEYLCVQSEFEELKDRFGAYAKKREGDN